MTALAEALLFVVGYFVMFQTQTELVVQAAGYRDPSADCALLWCSWTAREATTGALVSGRAECSPLLDCRLEPIAPPTGP